MLDWREAAALFVAADRADDATERVAEAFALAARTIGSLGAGAEPRAAQLAQSG